MAAARVAFLAAEAKVIVVHFRRESHSFSLSEIPAVAGLFFFTPNEYMVAVLTGSAIAMLLTSRLSAVKLAFNLANFGVIAVVAHGDLPPLAGADRRARPTDWIAAFAATLSASGRLGVRDRTAISLSGGAPQFQKLPEMIRFGAMVAMANTSLALLAVTVMWIDPSAVWLLVVPLVTVFLAYGAYVSEREKHERLELLYQSSRILQHSPELDSALVALLDHARKMFRAEVAEVLLQTRGGGPKRPADDVDPRRVAGGDGPVAWHRTTRSRPARGRATGVLPGPIRRRRPVDPAGDGHAADGRVRDDRLDDGREPADRGHSFDDDDLRLLETLANQAAVALENGQLEQSLAGAVAPQGAAPLPGYHDPLTGLANRALFAEQVERHLADARPGSALAVLFLDLDDFKVVNDTLGHAAGDRLLRRGRGAHRERASGATTWWRGSAATSSRCCCPTEDGPRPRRRRRGPDHRGAAGVVRGRGQDLVGRRIDRHRRRARPAPTTTCSATPTSRCTRRRPAASAASRSSTPTMHAAIVARHALSGELARASATASCGPHYQPIVELATGEPRRRGLVRWRHPTAA